MPEPSTSSAASTACYRLPAGTSAHAAFEAEPEKKRKEDGGALPRPSSGRKGASLRSLAPLALAPGCLRRGGGGGVEDEKTGEDGSSSAHRIPHGS